VLSLLYQNVRLYVNFFQPSFKLKEKRREGSLVHNSRPWRTMVGEPRIRECP